MENTHIIKNKKESFKLFFKGFDIPRWVGLVGLLVFSISIVFYIHTFLNFASDDKLATPNSYGPADVWFGLADRFTNQSNLLLIIFTFFFVFYPKHQFMKGNGFLLSTMVYITFTFVGYNVILVGFGGYGYKEKGIELVGNIWLHIICPIYFVIFGYITMLFRKNDELKSFWKILLYGMIYPTIYTIYVVSIPFIYTSYYKFQENANGDYVWKKTTYSVYGSATNTKDNPISWVYICVMYFLFFPGMFATYYFSWKGINKLKK